MKMEDYISTLVRASLDNDLRTVRSISTKIIRNVKQSNPEMALKISEALNFHNAGLSSTRSLGYGTLPQDQDSRSDLLVVQEPIEIDKPIFDEKINGTIQTIIDERNSINILMSAGLAPTASILLFGAPGVGKTLLAKYFSNIFQLKFASLDMASAVSSYLGKTGQNLKKVLDYAKEEPTLLLLDEFDAIAKRRDDSTDLGELKRVVNVLLKELEDWPSNSIVIAATNHPELLDKAIWRRFDLVIEIGMPDLLTREKLFKYGFIDSKYVHVGDQTFQLFALLTDGFTPAEIIKLCEKSKKQFILYGGNIEKIIIAEIANTRTDSNLEFNKKFCLVAKEFGMTYREMGSLLDKSISAIQNYIKGGKK